MATEAGRGKRRTMDGVVVSDKMQKTVVVLVTHRVLDATYHKYVTRRMKYKAHSESDQLHAGDRVRIVESRPLSRDKRWRVQRLLEKSQQV